MKRSIISAAVLSAVFMSAGAFAAEGTLTINGKISGTSCTFDHDQSQATIELAPVPVSEFLNTQVGAALDMAEKEAPKPLIIDCAGTGKNIRITFEGSKFDNNNILINTSNDGPAKGAGFKIYHNNKLVTKDGSFVLSLSDLKRIGDSSKYELDLSARYARSSSDVTEGNVSGVTTVNIFQD